MANNVFQVKRTNVSGRTPNTTGSYGTNSQYIAAGEFALNMADGILYSSNGSAVITVGSNLVNQNITGNLTVKAIIANGSIGTAGQVLTTNSTGVYWSTAGGGSGTVTSVATGNGMTGGPITTTGTVSVLANTGIVANSTGTFVNATYIGTLTANNTSFVGTVSAANVVSNAQLSGNLANYQTTAGLSANVATLTSNNSTFSYGKTEGALNVNSALTANNSTNLGGVAASGYQTTAGLAGNVATLTANNANFVKANNGITSNSSGVFVTQGTGTVVNATGVHVNATYIGTLTSNNATFAFGKSEGNLNVNNAVTVNGFRNLGTISVQAVAGSSVSCTTAEFIAWYSSNYSFLSYGYTVAKCSWSYANNNDISDTIIGSLELAGCTIETFSDGTYYSIRITRPTTGTGSGMILVYNNQGASYSPGWRIVLDNTNYNSYSPTLTGTGATGTWNITANNATNLNGQAASFYTNASNISTGTLPDARLSSAVVNTSGTFTRTGITTFSANVILGSSGLSANGGFGTAGQTLHSNGTATYWATDDQGVTSVATGNGMTGGPITTTGTVSILANTGIVANSTGAFVNAAYIATIASNSALYANASITNTFTVGTGSYFVSNGNVGIGTATPAYKLEVNGSFAATTKSFVINHPTKESQFLRYGSLEGPENGVYVRGRLDGKSIIELPDYWWNLIDESTITVNLTPIGRSQDIWVQSTSAYFIHLNQPADCFFTVFAERKDVDKLVVEY